jgi:hypothetical protein
MGYLINNSFFAFLEAFFNRDNLIDKYIVRNVSNDLTFDSIEPPVDILTPRI